MPEEGDTAKWPKERYLDLIRKCILDLHEISVMTASPEGGPVSMSMEPYYMNMDWDNRPYLIGRRTGGWKPLSEKKVWIIIYLDNIANLGVLETRFKPRENEFISFKKTKQDAFIRPSRYEISTLH